MKFTVLTDFMSRALGYFVKLAMATDNVLVRSLAQGSQYDAPPVRGARPAKVLPEGMERAFGTLLTVPRAT